MLCSGCSKKLNILRRERTCANCNLVFCEKCLSDKSSDSNDRICRCCLKGLPDAPVSSTDKVNRLSTNSESKSNQSSEYDMDVKDVHERLGKLKDIQNASDAEIEHRLRNLREDDSGPSNYDWVLKPQPKKSTAELVSALLNEAVDEQRLISKMPNPDAEIARRLSLLKSDTTTPRGEKAQKLNEEDDVDYLSRIDRTLQESKVDEIHTKDEQIRHIMQQRADWTTGTDTTEESVNKLLREAEAGQKSRTASSVSLTDDEIRRIMARYAAADSKNGPSGLLLSRALQSAGDIDEEEVDEEQLAAVIKEALSTPDEEDDIRNA